MLDNLSQENFEHIIDVLILFNQLNPKKEVSLSEKSIKDALLFMNTIGNEFADKLGIGNV